jgi:hypothetical protein
MDICVEILVRLFIEIFPYFDRLKEVQEMWV